MALSLPHPLHSRSHCCSLRNLQADVWGDQVTVVSCDMRHFRPSEQADILVSELLGSFGDNELSPECLDGAQSFLKPGGVSIPRTYTSYAAPLSSSKLWNEARGCKEVGKSHEVSRSRWPPPPLTSTLCFSSSEKYAHAEYDVTCVVFRCRSKRRTWCVFITCTSLASRCPCSPSTTPTQVCTHRVLV